MTSLLYMAVGPWPRYGEKGILTQSMTKAPIPLE